VIKPGAVARSTSLPSSLDSFRAGRFEQSHPRFPILITSSRTDVTVLISPPNCPPSCLAGPCGEQPQCHRHLALLATATPAGSQRPAARHDPVLRRLAERGVTRCGVSQLTSRPHARASSRLPRISRQVPFSVPSPAVGNHFDLRRKLVASARRQPVYFQPFEPHAWHATRRLRSDRADR
jgi:hypothetical protein